MNLDDGGLVPMTDASVVSPSDPSWSPDARRVVFSAQAPGDASEPRNRDLYVFDLVNSTTSRLTETSDHNEVQPSWSPDGNSIAFVQVSNALGDTLDGGIRLMTPDGTTLKVLTAGGTLDQHPTWSPDGRLIAFDRSIGGSTVYTVQPSDLDLVEIGPGLSPAWQPLGDGLPQVTIPTPSGDEGNAATDIGLGFPVCDVRSIYADFDGTGTSDTASVATKMSDVGGCPASGTATEVLVVDLNGDGKADASGGPLACPTGCEPFATPDIDGDGLPEIAIIVDRPADGTKRIQLWDLMTPPGGTLAVIPFIDANGDPATFSWGFDGTNRYGVYCNPSEAGARLIEWQAIPTGPASYHISEHGYMVAGTELQSSFENSFDVPGDRSDLPDGGGDTICGVPVQPSG
jgi:hypothetical protein